MLDTTKAQKTQLIEQIFINKLWNPKVKEKGETKAPKLFNTSRPDIERPFL